MGQAICRKVITLRKRNLRNEFFVLAKSCKLVSERYGKLRNSHNNYDKGNLIVFVGALSAFGLFAVAVARRW